MNGLSLRFRMHHCLKVIDKSSNNNELGICRGEDLTKLCQNPKNVKAIHALSSGGYISIPNIDNSSIPAYIVPEDKLPMYFVERSEIWFNRFLGFIAGVLSTVLADLIIRLL